MKPIRSLRTLTVAALLLPAVSTTAATFSIVHSFGVLANVTGFNPQAPLVQGPDGTLYGTTASGEGTVGGVVFKINPDGTGFRGLKYFTNSLEGADPVLGLAAVAMPAILNAHFSTAHAHGLRMETWKTNRLSVCLR